MPRKRPAARTTVIVTVVLQNDRRCRYSWVTPVAFGRALSKGGKWARQEMRAENVTGRSKIRSMTVTVEDLR